MRSGAGYKRHQTSAYCDDCDDGIRGHDPLPSSVAGASRPSAGVRSSPHSHPKTLPSCPHSERGPSSTVLSPHSSHTRMTCLDVSVTSNPLLYPVGHDRSCRSGRRRPSEPLRATRPSSTSPSVPAGGASRQGGVASTCRSARTLPRAEARVHLYLNLSLYLLSTCERRLLLSRKRVDLKGGSKLEDILRRVPR